MYRAVNVNEDTYKLLQKISIQLNKPRAQVVGSLAREYVKITEKRETERLKKFNQDMGSKIRALKFSKKIKVSTADIDADFSVLAKTSYMR